MPDVLISSPAGVLAVLVAVAAFWFFVEQKSGLTLFQYVPPLIFIYVTPVFLNNLDVIPADSPVYSGLSAYALPIFIVLMLIKVDVPSAVRALKLHVSEFLEKPFHDQEFLAAIQKSVEQDTRRLREDRRTHEVTQKIESLSARERDVLEGVVGGLSSKMIAANLGLSPKTVENYRATLMDKLNAENVAHLVTQVYSYFNVL